MTERIRWSALRELGNSRSVRAASMWLVIGPILARVYNATIFVDLPLGFGVLYLAAFAFFVAEGVYLLRCPLAIRQYSGPGDFFARNGPSAALVFGDLLRKGELESLPLDLRTPLSLPVAGDEGIWRLAAEKIIDQDHEFQVSLFSRYWSHVERARPRSFFVCLTLFAAGGLGLLVVLLQNLGRVVASMFS